MPVNKWPVLFLLPVAAGAQSASTDELLKSIMNRLDKVEEQNRQLMDEIKGLRAQLAQGNVVKRDETTPQLEQRVEVAEQRVEEQAQTKVEASQRFPIKITGALLFNAFANTGNTSIPYGDLLTGPEPFGATFRQTLLGLDFNGPALPGGGTASGSVTLDFAGGAAPYANGATVNLRRAVLNLDWARRSVSFGQDKPLVSRRSPDSLAEVLVPPLASAGNPWIWIPQLRYVERFGTGERSGFNVETSLLETDEDLPYGPPTPTAPAEKARPALEGRVEYWFGDSEGRRFEFAPGFHVSDSHVGGFSVPSRIATFDWLVQPWKRLRFKGLVFTGENLATISGFFNGFYSDIGGEYQAVRGVGGWTEISYDFNRRLTLNAFGGFQAPRNDGLQYDAVSRDSSFAANLVYRIAPNILLGAEALQERVGYVGTTHTIRDHYDLAIGYLF